MITYGQQYYSKTRVSTEQNVDFLVEENIKDRARVRQHKETKGGKLHRLLRRALNPRNQYHCFIGDLLSRLNSGWTLLKAV